ncbi:HEAT repeat domain-containing protein [Fimbriiglobus ruber]|nr:HEAT repeat domain-containing protein [Fimbriiglobus ruber]
MVLVAVLLVFPVARAAAQSPKHPDQPPKTIDQWITELGDNRDREKQAKARDALGPDGSFGSKAVPALIDVFADPKKTFNFEIQSILVDHGSAAVPDLIKALKRPEPDIRIMAVHILGNIRPRPKEAIPALIQATKDTDPAVRGAAACSLSAVSRSVDKTVPVLIALLADPDDTVRSTAATSLGDLEGKAKPAVGALVTALNDKDRSVREEATIALARVGPGASPAIPALIAAFRKWPVDDSNRTAVVDALGRIRAGSAVPTLIAALTENDDDLRETAAYALGSFGPAAIAAVPNLLHLAKVQDVGTMQDTVIEALSKIDPSAKSAVPVILDAFNGLKDTGRAATSLGRYGAGAKAALPKLAALARDLNADERDREAAVKAIEKIDPEFATRQGMALAYLNIRLGKLAAVTLKPHPAVTEDQKEKIRALIAELAKVGQPGHGLSASMSGHAFAPLPDQTRWGGGILPNQGFKSSDAFRDLVAMGPTALPFLLEALDDKTSTKMKVRTSSGIMGVGGDFRGNPLNSKESRAIATEFAETESEKDSGLIRTYTVKVGDVCFAVIGQIVGRSYQVVQYIPSDIFSINSPTATPAMRTRLRAAWSGADPARALLDSLLIDYATEGKFNGRSLDGWDKGSSYQIEAVVRLLYYFPDEMAPVVAARLRSLDVGFSTANDAWMKREVRNGVRTADFLRAVSWCQAAPIQAALADLARRPIDPKLQELIPVAKK